MTLGKGTNTQPPYTIMKSNQDSKGQVTGKNVMTKNANKSRNQDLTSVFAAADRRTDQWRQLHALSRAWATAPANGDQAESLRADAASTLGSIARLEQCWAYPGPRLLTALDETIEQRDAPSFAR